MTRDVLIAGGLISRLLGPAYGEGGSEDAALHIAGVTERLSAKKVDERSLPLFCVSDTELLTADDLSAEGWIWLLEKASAQDDELPDRLLNDLYDAFTDAIVRVRIVDAVTSHPALDRRLEEAIGGFRRGQARKLPDLPPNWPTRWLRQRLDPREEHADEPSWSHEGRGAAIQEMTLYLLQAGTETALTVLAGLLRDDSGLVELAREAVDRLTRDLGQTGERLRSDLGLGDRER